MTTQGAPFERGYKLGKYEVIGPLSVGGMAELYLAFLTGQGGFRKFVALKRVLPAAAQQESFVKMFLDEARITASLSHANVAQVFELTETPENAEPVLAMEFVAGQNLAQIVKRARARGLELTPGFCCRVLHDVLLGLHSAHHFVEPTSGRPMPVIHRDINPRNIMVTYAGGTKIIDFGIAKARDRLDTTQVGMVKGTLQYMSPEQVMLKELDGRSDLFAVSVVLYELLSGKRVFDDSSDAAMFHRIASAEVPPLGVIAPALPAGLAEVVMKGLARKAEDRWKSGREYARALDQAAPELFDDEQVAQLMGRLFEDKIDVTRSLLQSTTTDASIANLTLMAQVGDDSDSKPNHAAPPPIGDVPTSPTNQKVGASPSPPSTSTTMLVDEPVVSGPSTMGAPTEANLEPVVTQAGSHERASLPRARESEPLPEGAATHVEGLSRKPTGGLPAQGRRRTVDGQPATRKPTSELQPLRRPTSPRTPVAEGTNDPAPGGSGPSAERPVPRRATSESGTTDSVSARGKAEETSATGLVLWLVLGAAVLALLAVLSGYAWKMDSAPEKSRPLERSSPRPPR